MNIELLPSASEPPFDVSQLPCCVVSGETIFPGETFALGWNDNYYSAQHLPTDKDRFLDVVKALEDPNHRLWNDVDDTIDALLDADDLHRKIFVFDETLFASSAELVHFASQHCNTPSRSDWIKAYGVAFGHLIAKSIDLHRESA